MPTPRPTFMAWSAFAASTCSSGGVLDGESSGAWLAGLVPDATGVLVVVVELEFEEGG